MGGRRGADSTGEECSARARSQCQRASPANGLRRNLGKPREARQESTIKTPVPRLKRSKGEGLRYGEEICLNLVAHNWARCYMTNDIIFALEREPVEICSRRLPRTVVRTVLFSIGPIPYPGPRFLFFLQQVCRSEPVSSATDSHQTKPRSFKFIRRNESGGRRVLPRTGARIAVILM